MPEPVPAEPAEPAQARAVWCLSLPEPLKNRKKRCRENLFKKFQKILSHNKNKIKNNYLNNKKGEIHKRSPKTKVYYLEIINLKSGNLTVK